LNFIPGSVDRNQNRIIQGHPEINKTIRCSLLGHELNPHSTVREIIGPGCSKRIIRTHHRHRTIRRQCHYKGTWILMVVTMSVSQELKERAFITAERPYHGKRPEREVNSIPNITFVTR
jgi:hypothetical protein